jgi:hypothetical protein
MATFLQLAHGALNGMPSLAGLDNGALPGLPLQVPPGQIQPMSPYQSPKPQPPSNPGGNGSEGNQQQWQQWGEFLGGVWNGLSQPQPDPYYNPYDSYPAKPYYAPQTACPSYPKPYYAPQTACPSNPKPVMVPKNSLPSSESSAAGSIVLVNPKKTAAAVHYLLDGHSRTLAAGYKQNLRAGRARLVEFDRGGAFGRARYGLRHGTYEFTVTDKGWKLFRKTYRVTVDNSANAGQFRYLVDNRLAVVAAGEARTHTSRHPIVIVYDPGGGTKSARETLESGVYEVRLNPKTHLLDLARSAAEAVAVK